MPISYNPATNRMAVTAFTAIAPCNFTDVYNADKAGTLSLHARVGVAAVDGAPVAVDRAERPADYVVLGGASNDLYITVANWVNMTTATIRIIGTDRDGAAQTEDLVFVGAGTINTTKWFKTITDTQVTVFTKSNAGSFDYDLIQGQWGVVWKLGTYQFLLTVDWFTIGDAISTPTWFADAGKSIVWDPEGDPTTIIWLRTNSEFRLGVVDDVATKSTSQGCHMMYAQPLARGFTYSYAGAIAYFYSCSFTAPVGEGVINFLRTGSRVWNCIFTNWIKLIGWQVGVDVYNVYVTSAHSTNILADVDTMVIRDMIFGVSSQVSAVTLRNSDVRNSSNKMFYAIASRVVDSYMIDCFADVWDFFWAGVGAAKTWRQYTFALRVVDATGAGIPNATVDIVNLLGAAVAGSPFTTDGSGDIATPTLNFGYYDKAGGDTPYMRTPHTVTISMAGYLPRTMIYTMDRAREEIEKLGGAAPHGMEYRRRRVPGEVSLLAEYE